MWAGGFRCCFTPLPGCFSPFPRGTSALSVTGEYLGLEGGPPCFPPGFTCPAVLGHRQAGVALRVRGSNPLRPGFPSGSARASLCNRTVDGPTTPARLSLGPVWPLPRSLATTGGISFDFSSSGYLDVSVPRVPFLKLWIHLRIHDSSPCGFPHSDICGSRLICSSPQLFAACRVLLRLLMPRHSPYALFSLNSFFRRTLPCSASGSSAIASLA